MKASWHKSDLASVVSILESGSRPKGGASTETGEVASLGGENIVQSGGVTLADVKRVPQAFFKRMTKGHLVDGDVLINKDGAQTGKVGIYLGDGTGSACINEHVFLIRGNKETICQDFLYYTLLSEHGQRQIAAQISGSAQPGLKSSFLKGVVTDIPDSLPEQAKIADVLSTVDQAIEQTEALIAKQQRIKTGLMQDLLTRGIDEHGNLRSEQTHEFKDSPLGRIPVEWIPSQIGNVATLQRGHDITENELHDGPYPVVSSSGIIGYHIQYTSKGPNVVVGRKGTIGKVHYLEYDFWAHDTSLYVTNFMGNNERYLFYLFNHLDLARYGTKSGSPSLNRNDIHPLWIGLPSPDEQSKIVTILMRCDQRLDSMGRGLEKLRSIKTALMQDLLTGEKRVTALLIRVNDNDNRKGVD